MRQIQIVKQPVRRPRPVELEPLHVAPAPDTSAADELLARIDAILAEA